MDFGSIGVANMQVSTVMLPPNARSGSSSPARSASAAIEQARVFTEAVGVTGIVLTKLDGTARGGVAIAVEQELDIPVKYIGVGEAVEDLIPFDPEAFVDALLGA